MTKKNEKSLGFGTIVMMALVGIGVSTVIYWGITGITGIINIVDRYSNFVEKVNNLDARTQYLRNRIEFIDDRLYKLDKNHILIEANGSTRLNNECFYVFSDEKCLTPIKSIVSDMIFAPSK